MNQTLLFLHIPKSAGTTLASCLTDNYYNKDYSEAKTFPYENLQKFYEGDIFYYPQGFYKDPLKTLPDHLISILNQPNLRVVTGHFSYGIHNYVQSESKYVTMLRDPVERVISLYYHLLTTNMIGKQVSLEQFLEGIPVDQWLLNLSDWYPVKLEIDEYEIRECSKRMVDNDQTRRVSGMEPPFGECDEAMFRQACQNITEGFTLVGLTEKFDESLLMLTHVLGWKREVHYVPKLKNKAKPHTKEIPAHLLEKIEELNHWDRKLYEFASERFDHTIKMLGPGFLEKVSQFSTTNKNFVETNDAARDWDIDVS